MFLQRNTASQVFVIPGSLRAVADGSAVTSSASITIVKDGTGSAGGGTLTHISGGAYKYAPTQGETDCKILGYVVEATGAITLAGSVRTTNADPNDAAALGLTRIDGAITSRMATYTQPTGFLAATFPTTVASTTNITAGTITTATNVTTVNGFAAGSITAASIASSALDGKGNWNVGKTGYSLTATTGLGNQTSNITGNLSGSVGSVTGAVGSVTGNVGGNVTGSVGSVTGLTPSTIADQVWDEILSGHAGVGSAGAALAAAGGSGDPWSTALPGAYGAGTAGYLVGTYLDAAVSTRSTYAGADTSGTTTLLTRVTAAVALAGTAPDWYADVTATGTVTGSPTTTSIPLTGLTGPITTSSYLVITSGTLKGQGRPITGVSGSTATVSPAFASAPATGVTVKIVGYHA